MSLADPASGSPVSTGRSTVAPTMMTVTMSTSLVITQG
jgi:hypothetical protein